jgi:pseudouridine-5'-phosphate glycosidase
MLELDPEVRDALAVGGAVVALESTIIAHGLPYPDNLAVASDLEAAVRAAGAVPATIAVVRGMAHVGLDADTLADLAERGRGFAKAGANDLAMHIATGSDAATTVSGTAFLAARAGIRLFATGGIGGVHRGDSGDVSNDLATLAKLPVAVVSAGAKTILDLPRTLEMLETLGVPVIGWRTGELPGFYTRSAGLALDHRVDDAGTAARVLYQRFDILAQGGVLIACPIPAEAALEPARIEAVIAAALDEAAAQGVSGKRLTPFLLKRIAEATGGEAVAANRALAIENARVAAAIAVAYAALR